VLSQCALLVFAAATLFGQANLGSITGTVKDQSGAVIANAPIEIRNASTGAVISAGTSATGNYSVPLPAGTYDLSVSVPGFKQFVQRGIPVVEGQATRRDVELELGQVSETVTVTDTAPLLKTEGGDISYRVTTNLANQLPILQLGGAAGLGTIRNPLQMTQVLPGVNYNTTGFQTMMINGLPSNSQTWTIEGQDATPTLWRGVTSNRGQPSVDAIEAMNVQTSNFAAEFGKAGGAAINYTMKSGTNQFHGSVYNYYVNEFLHAGTPDTDWIDQSNAANNFRFDYLAGQHVRNRQRRNNYGGTIGGPIVLPKLYDGHNKSFFFFNFEQFRETQRVGTGIATVPTLAYRNGDFTAAGCTDYDTANNVCRFRPQITLGGNPATDPAGNPIINGGIYDPNTYRIVNGFPVRDLYPNQRIPVANFDRVAANIQALLPLPTNNNLVNNYTIPPYDNYRRMTIPSIKIDHNFDPTLRINGYFSQTRTDQNNANGFPPEQFPWTSQQSTPYRNNTVRINLDKTITPTLIFHVGVGYFHQKEPNIAPRYDQSKLGLPGAGAINAFPFPNAFPTINGLNSASGGLSPGIGVGFDAIAWEQKPTGNINLTWVKGNHTYKFGGDTTLQGYPTHNRWRANGNMTFAPQQSGNPWTDGQALNIPNPTGFNYASFLLGTPNLLELAQPTYTRLGGHAWALFAQDNWKVTPKWTIEYGLRYDYQTYLREQHGRLASASFDTLHPVTGHKGALIYEATCKCNFSSNYPFAFGPRFSTSYQLTSKTVFRAGFGVNYNVVQTPAGNNFSVGDNYFINPDGFGLSAMPQRLQGGFTFYKGNPFGNTEVIWPVFDPGRLPARNAGLLPPAANIRTYHPGSRPGRIMQWSIGLQHEIVQNLVVEANYVGNRGAWFYSPQLDTMSINSLGGGRLAQFGLDISREADRTLLTQLIGSSQAAARGFFSPYAGFPPNQQVAQALRPIPHYTTILSYLGPNRGNTWYDSLQVQVTKRYSHNLDLTANFTYSHATVLGVSSDTDFFLRGRPLVTDPFNRRVNKQINQLNPPLKTVIAGTYTTPGLAGAQGWMRGVSTLLKDWQVSAVLQYQSGDLLIVPNSNNQLTTLLRLGLPLPPPFTFDGGQPAFNPWNYIQGQPFFRPGFDPNGKFDPRQYNPNNPTDPAVVSVLAGGLQPNGSCNVAACAWSNPGPGQWGTTSPTLEGFRWRRAPSEAFNFGRNFRMGSDGRIVLNVRAEFTNIFNRRFYAAPSTANPLAPVTTTTQRGMIIPTGGFGVVNTLNGAGSQPRQGTLVARLTF
jgi:hypothetical protein